MYKENHIIRFENKLCIQEFGNEVTLNIETVGKRCNMGRYYFHCNECENQSIADDEGTCWSCNNYCPSFDYRIRVSLYLEKGKISCRRTDLYRYCLHYWISELC